MKTGSPVPAIALSAVLHGAVWWLIPRGGTAILGAPGDPMPPLVWVDVAEVLAMPGTGTDLLAGPGSSSGGSPMPLAGAQPTGGGRAPEAPEPGEEASRGDGTRGVSGGPQPVDLTVVDRPVGGVPVRARGESGGEKVEAEARDAVMRALALDSLLDGGISGTGYPGFGDGTEPGADGEFFGMGHRQGTATDPEILLWQTEVRRRLRAEFHPLPSLRTSNPDLRVRIRVVLDPASGRIVERALVGTSGIRSFDRASLAAVDSVGVLPPVPERWRETVAAGLELRFTHDL